MKTSFSMLFLLLMAINTSAQFKTVRFEIIDKLTKQPVSGISAIPNFTGDTAVSNEKGMLIIKVPKGYKDTITLSNAEYYPLVTRITPGPPGKSITVFMIHRLSKTDSVSALDGINNRTVAGKVYHYHQGQMLDSVGIWFLSIPQIQIYAGYNGKIF